MTITMRRATRQFLLGPLLLLACRDAAAPGALIVQPPCAQPSPLLGKFDARAPGYIVVFHADVDARQEATRLAAQYRFEPRAVWEFALRGFGADLTPAVVASLRCEASVQHVQFNQSYTQSYTTAD